MPIKLEIDKAMLQWQARHNQRMTYAELAKEIGISLATLNRMKNGDMTNPDLRKINLLCKVLECDLPQLMVRYDTALDLAARHGEALDLEKKEKEDFIARKSGAEKETGGTGMFSRQRQR
ncbi:MAG: helix-turn-helix transcriptional regulator [Anaerolineae bacterium]|nr:helix-turn-helix transcriptional regulator [Anaerolineae bacterium]